MTSIPQEVSSLKQAAEWLLNDGEVYQIVADITRTKGGKHLQAFFSNPGSVAPAFDKLISSGTEIKFTVNPVKPELYNRSAGRLSEAWGKKWVLEPGHISFVRHIPITILPVMATGIPATAEQSKAAREKAQTIEDDLAKLNWQRPVVVDFGDGTTLLYQTRMANCAETENTLKKLLKKLGDQYDDKLTRVDRNAYGPVCYVNLPGTVRRIGDSTADRRYKRVIGEYPLERLEVTEDQVLDFLKGRPKGKGSSNTKASREKAIVIPFDSLGKRENDGGDRESSNGGNEVDDDAANPQFQATLTHRQAACLLDFSFSDTGNAERLLAMYGDDLLYCHETKTWLVWDGRRFAPDRKATIRRRCVTVARELYRQASELPDESGRDKKHKQFIEEWARGMENAGVISTMLQQATAFARSVVVAELDSNPWRLNCANGTVDLKTGMLLPHDRLDLITKLCPVELDPTARCPIFSAFLNRIMSGKERLIGYLQRAFGYALTGDVAEKAVFCFFGNGDNGKTTLLEIVRYVPGDYGAQVLIDTLMARPSESNASLADLADLRRARFVTTSEAEEGRRLAEAKVKYLSGMGEIKTARKYENHIAFAATHKLFIDANHRPVVRGTDQAIWNRLKPVPFTATIPKAEQDKRPLKKMRAEAPGILVWMVKGCLDWQRDGLGNPSEIESETKEWREENDPLKEVPGRPVQPR